MSIGNEAKLRTLNLSYDNVATQIICAIPPNQDICFPVNVKTNARKELRPIVEAPNFVLILNLNLGCEILTKLRGQKDTIHIRIR